MQINDDSFDIATTITFELGGVLLKSGGTTATITLQVTNEIGHAYTVDIDPPSAAGNKRCEEAETGDALTKASILEIIGGGETTAPQMYAFTVTIRQ
jgi:hypothetical protein